MLDELDIRNFAIIDHLRLRFGPGLTVLTGETGAGKSIIIDALGVLLGGRAAADLVREGEAQARVEGIFLLPEDPRLDQLLAEHGVECEDGTLILSRELGRGRGSARLNGRAVPLSVVQSIGSRLVDIHGQTEHLALLRATDQLELLDRFAGVGRQREAMAALVRHLRAVRAQLVRLSGDEREAARRLDLLRYQVEEIERAAPAPGEDAALEGEIRLLAGAARLRELATQLHATLAGGDADTPAAEDALGAAARLAADLARIDPAQEGLAARLDGVLGDVQDLAREARRYAEAAEDDPERLAVAQERQEVLRGLKRKYGASIAEVLAYREQAAAEAAGIANADERRAELQEEERRVAAEAGRAAEELSAARHAAAGRLAERVQRELAGLNMRGAQFQVRLGRQPDAEGLEVPSPPAPLPGGEGGGGHVDDVAAGMLLPSPMGRGAGGEGERYAFDPTGVDQVEFLVAPNVGESPKPVAKIASGGETSRIMLALKSALSEADQTGTLIFDEVDVGVGGRSGQVIGEKLWGLGRHHQVICITHLPQVAVYGDRHQRIQKLVKEGRTATAVEELDTAKRVDEVALMLGGHTVTAITRRASEDLLEGARRWKEAPRAEG